MRSTSSGVSTEALGMSSTTSTRMGRPSHRARSCLSPKSNLALVYKLGMSAESRWRRLRGFKQLINAIDGIKFINGVDERTNSRKKAA